MSADARVVLLLDADCFFCAVHARRDPALRGTAFAVYQRHSCACVSYEARTRLGLRNSCSTDAAKAAGARLVPCDMPLVQSATAELREAMARFGPVEMASCDEAFLDLTAQAAQLAGTGPLQGRLVDDAPPLDQADECERRLVAGSGLAARMKAAVLAETGLVVSAGVGPNKLLAKLAAGMHKPDGLTTFLPRHRPLVFNRLSLAAVPQIGTKSRSGLAELGVHTCADLYSQLRPWEDQLYEHPDQRFELPLPVPDKLVQLFGRAKAAYIWDSCRGWDSRPVAGSTRPVLPKSLTVDACCRPADGFEPCTLPDQLYRVAQDAAAQLAKRVSARSDAPRRLSVKWRWFNQPGSCVSRTCCLEPDQASDPDQLAAVCVAVLRKELQRPFRLSRLILTVSQFGPRVSNVGMRNGSLTSWLRGKRACAGEVGDDAVSKHAKYSDVAPD